MREKRDMLKRRAGRKKKADGEVEEDKKIEDDTEEVVVKDDYVASGSRDKRIKIWNAKRGT